MKLFKWLPGRQPGVEYQKLCFLHLKIWRVGLDGYIIHYPGRMDLPTHTDPFPQGKMWRLNITLKGCATTYYYVGETGVVCFRYIGLFRPDIQSHGVWIMRPTYKLSFGFAKFNKTKGG